MLYLLVYCLLGAVAGLALGMAISVKLLLGPMVLLFLVWLVAEVREGRLDRASAWRAAAATLLPGPAPLWATTLPATAVVLLGVWRVWSRPGQRTLLATSGLGMLGVLCFHRSFMFYDVDIPATALLLAALVPGRALAPWPSVRTGTGRSPRGWSPIGSR